MRHRRWQFLLETGTLLLLLSGATTRAALGQPACVPNPAVTNNSNSGDGSLRGAIETACSGSIVTFATTVASPIILEKELRVNQNLTIQGPGASLLTISGNGADRVFNIGSFSPGVINVTLSDLTIANGHVGPNTGFLGGGGIFNNFATLTIVNCTLSDNSVSGSCQGFGGGIWNFRAFTVNVLNSTFTGNSAQSSDLTNTGCGSSGGGIFNSARGTLNVVNSTFFGNIALSSGVGTAFGGAITNSVGSTLNITNSTFSGNTASSDNRFSLGGGIYAEVGTVKVQNTLIAGNTVVAPPTASRGPDVYGNGSGIFSSLGFNLIGKTDGSGASFTDPGNHDQVGTTASPLDPMLDPEGLRNNGGPTPTIALLPRSPAIDKGSAANDPTTGSPITTDQRGFARPTDLLDTSNATGGNGSDVGAFEFLANPTACVPPPNTTMVAWYPFDETTGALSVDLAAGNWGIQVGDPTPPTPVPGMVAGALRFDGASNYVESASSIVTNVGAASLSPTCSGGYSSCPGNFSIDAWIRVDPLGQDVMTILDKRVGSPPEIKGYHLVVLVGSDSSIGLQLADGLGSGFSNYFSPDLTPALNDGNWHHIAVTVRRTKQRGIRWYHNGVRVGHSDPRDRLGSLENSGTLRIGTRTSNSPLSGWFQGDLDELEIYNRVLTPQEVATIFTAGASGKCK